MIHLPPEAGRLPVPLADSYGEGHVDEIMDQVLHDTPEFYDLSEETRSVVINSIRKAALVGLEKNPNEIPEFDEDEKITLLEEILIDGRVSVDSPYVTFHDVILTAKRARDYTLEAINLGNVYEVGREGEI